MTAPRMLLTAIGFTWWMLNAVGGAAAASGTLLGTVSGPGATRLPGALVVVTAADGLQAAAVVTGEGGHFHVPDLAPGRYGVEARLSGFHPGAVDDVEVAAGTTTRVDLTLASATFRDSVEVRAASPLDTLEASELRETGARDLGEVLQRVPGVWKVRKGGIANDVSLRGFRQDDLTILIDGARVAGACPNRMDPPAFHLDFAEVDRVEVGPSTGRMTAQGSLGGMINVVTKKPAPDLSAEATMVAGSWHTRNPSATVGYGGERAGLLVGASTRSSLPYEDGSGRPFTDAANYSGAVSGKDAYEVTSFWSRAYAQPAAGHELSLSWARQEADDVLYPALLMDAVSDDTDRLVLGYRYAGSGGVVQGVSATAYLTQVDHWMVDSLRTSAVGAPRGWSMGTRATTSVTGLSMQADLATVTVGLETYRRNWNAWTEMAGMGYRRQFSIPDVDVEAVGVTAHWTALRTAAGGLELGGRLDRVETTADPAKANTDLYFAYHGVRDTSRTNVEPSLSVAFSHQISAALELSASMSRTSRAPDPRERYFALRRKNADWVGNPDLAPPRNTGAEIGLTWTRGVGLVNATAFVDRVSDYITLYSQDRLSAVPGVMNTTAKTYANVDALLRGATVQATAAVTSRLYLAGDVAWVRGTKDTDAALDMHSPNLAEMPPLTASLATRWQSPRWHAEVEGVLAARQDRTDSDLDEQPTPGYAVLNLRAGVRLGSWRLQAALENALDRTYHEHFSYVRDPFRSGVVVNEPGRSLTLIAGWKL